MVLTLAFSPCPNDTFAFCGLATGRLRLEGFELEPHLHDVQTLNERLVQGRYDFSKVSFPAYLRCRDRYRLLNAGCAIGFGCGPLVVARGSTEHREARPTVMPDLSSAVVAIPGELTTAHLLLRLWAPAVGRKLFVRYEQVMPMVAAGQADFGVVIHEGRFTYQRHGLRLVADLGQWWESQTHLPLPLGGTVARRSLGDDLIERFDRLLAQSIRSAMGDPAATGEYVRQHAQEMDDEVLRQHIHAFVNDFSLGLGPQGRQAVSRLEQMAAAAGGA